MWKYDPNDIDVYGKYDTMLLLRCPDFASCRDWVFEDKDKNVLHVDVLDNEWLSRVERREIKFVSGTYVDCEMGWGGGNIYITQVYALIEPKGQLQYTMENAE